VPEALCLEPATLTEVTPDSVASEQGIHDHLDPEADAGDEDEYLEEQEYVLIQGKHVPSSRVNSCRG
jgi:hypothetical protein